MIRRIWLTTIFLGLFYAIAWASPGNWLDPTTRQASLRLLAQQFLLCLAGFLLWGAFYAQFILPLQTVQHRFQAIARLFLHFFKRHGAAIFVENGVPRERVGEEDMKGPGLIWLDTASGAVLRSNSRFTRVIGPGIHFTARGEILGGTVDLRTQNQMIGPRPGDDPFAPPPGEGADEAARIAYDEARRRANETLAHTADHHPVVPNIIVIFKLKAQPAQGAAPGSRFGFSEESVFKAITNTMVDMEEGASQGMKHWNEIPAYIAADVWRELLEKYPLNELFAPLLFDPGPDQPPDNEPPQTAAAEEETAPRSPLREYLADLDRWLGRQAHILNMAFFRPQEEKEEDCQPLGNVPAPQGNMTVLEFIQRMMRQRLGQKMAQELDNEGRPTGNWYPSPEYQQMDALGIQVRAVVVTNLRFQPDVENHLITNWADQWLRRASRRSREIDDYLDRIAQETRQKTIFDFSTYLANRINRASRMFLRPSGHARSRQALASALDATHDYLTGNDRLRQGLRSEVEHLREIRRQVADDLEEDETP